MRSPPPPPRAAAAAASAAARRPASERSAVWANPVVSPTTTRMPAPRSRPGAQLLDPAVVEAGRRWPACPRRTPRRSRRRCAGRRRGPAGSRLRRAQGLLPVACRTLRRPDRGCVSYRDARRTRPGRRGRARRHRCRHGDRAALAATCRARHAPGRRAGEEAAVAAIDGRLGRGETSVGHAGAARPPRPVRGRAPRSRPRPPSRRSRAAGSPSPCRSTTSGASSPPARSPGSSSTASASWTRPADEAGLGRLLVLPVAG